MLSIFKEFSQQTFVYSDLIYKLFSFTDISREELLQRIVIEFKVKLPSNIRVEETMQLENEFSNTPIRPMSLREKLLAQHIPNQRTIKDNTIEGELMRFQDVHDVYDDTLGFWEKYSDHYPILSAIARTLFCIRTTTATAESSFSFARSVIRNQIATIDPFRGEKFLFIHDNYDLFNA